jgi:hypothetical protein
MSEAENTVETSTCAAAHCETAATPAKPGLLCQVATKSKSLVSQVVPATQLALTSAAYHGGYYLAFGVTFPTLFAVHMIPGGRRMVSGFVDGALAARDYLDNLEASKAAKPAATAEAPASA